MNKTFLLLISIILVQISFAKDKQALTLEKIFKSSAFSQKSVYGLNPMKDGNHYSVLEEVKGQQQINRYDYEKGKLAGSLLKNDLKDESGEPIDIESYELSEDESLILIKTNSERIYRHSMRSAYYLYNVADKSNLRIGSGKFQLAQISPDNKHISFVRKNNLYLFDIAAKKEIQVSTDGKANEIINGAPDWVYEEEFALVQAYEWGPNGKYLVYYKFDESAVKQYSFPVYGTLYPTNYVYKYPKVGEDNSKVSLLIYQTDNGKTLPIKIDLPFEYIPRLKWTNLEHFVSFQIMNRKQNKVDMLFADARTGTAVPVFGEKSDTYLEVKDVQFLKKRNAFLWESELKAGHNQVFLYEFDMLEDPQIGATFVVPGGKIVSDPGGNVTDIIGLNEENNDFYYVQTDRFNPGERFVFVNNIENMIMDPRTMIEGMGYVQPSENFKYFISYSSSATSPLLVRVFNDIGISIRTLEDNQALKDTVENYQFSEKEFFKFLTRDSIELFGWMMKPVDFNPDKKYPVLMYVYGGPGSQTVQNTWGGSNEMWYRYLNSKGYIVVSVDNRGTGARGKEFRDCTYGQLGNLETIDQIEAAKYMSLKTYVDEERIGIWGWSYGGYMSTLCLAKGHDLFKMAIAVAPVTNWKYYDNIYTERYMGLITENKDGYEDNSPINHVGKIKGKYLLVHGTADDNVHFQNSAELMDALVRENVKFDMGVYPNKNHGIYGGNTRYHLYTKMTDFILENL